MDNRVKWGGAALLALSVALMPAARVNARPRMEPLGDNIADRGSAFYRFATCTFTSADGLRHYKVWIGVPRQAAPAACFPVLYLLDGNAAMARLSERRLQQLTTGTPLVLVAVGYDTPLPLDMQARVLDYAPARRPARRCATRTLCGRRQSRFSRAAA